jgi:hypothetical protein
MGPGMGCVSLKNRVGFSSSAFSRLVREERPRFVHQAGVQPQASVQQFGGSRDEIAFVA